MDTKQRILKAALEEFTEHGYHGAKIRNICQKAKINIAAVNYHFRGKEALYQHVIEYIFQITDPLDEARKISASELTPEIFLKTIIGDFVKNAADESPLIRYRFRMMLREMINPSPFFAEILKNNIKPRFQKIKDAIKNILPEGTSEKELDVAGFLTIAQCIYLFNKTVIDTLTDEKDFTKNNPDIITERIFNAIFSNSKRDSKK